MSATVVITGGIGSGKSLVCSYLKEAGIPVFDSDTAAKAVYDIVPDMPRIVSNAVGIDVTGEDGRVDKRKLAIAVFEDKARLKSLEDVVWPLVFDEFSEWKDEQNHYAVAFETALYSPERFPAGFADEVVLVRADEERRFSRASCRDGADVAAIARRNALQPAPEASCATYVIENDGSIEELRDNTDKFIAYLKNRYEI